MSRCRDYAGYHEFFPYYVAMHSRPATRRLHFIGTVAGALLSLAGALTGRRAWLPALPVLGYGFAWPSHFFIEGNNPASFGHPLWSLRGDGQLIVMMLRGRDAELSVMARDYLQAHPEARTAANWRAPDARAA